MKIIRSVSSLGILRNNWAPTFGLSSIKEKGKDIRKIRVNPKTDIISLTSEEIYQLSTIKHYTVSVGHLEKNELEESKKSMVLASKEVIARFPSSINLQMCLMNRFSILEKLLGNKMGFLSKLEQLFLMCLTLKGEKSLDTLKHFQNYLTALIIFNPRPIPSIVEFLKENSGTILLKKMDYLVGIAEFSAGKFNSAFQRVKQSMLSDRQNKAPVLNNIGWMLILEASGYELDSCPAQNVPVVGQALQHLVRSLLEAEKHGDMDSTGSEIDHNLQMLEVLEAFAARESAEASLLKKVDAKTLLMNSKSHVIVMNIAHALFLLNHQDEALVFLKLALDNAIKLHEPDRLGLAVLLLIRIKKKSLLPWEPTLLEMLRDRKVYSLGIMKKALTLYSQFLFLENRFYEAENYLNQSEVVDATILTEGLYLEDFDFSF